MEKNMIKTNFIKIFSVEKNAEKFAKEKNSKVQVRYEWDDMKQKVVRQFIVKY